MGKDKIRKFLVKYLENETDPKDLWTMSKKWIVELTNSKFKKQEYSKREIEDLLDEIISDEETHFVEEDASFKIIYPKNKREKVKRYWAEHALTPYKKRNVALFLYISLFISTYLIFPKYLIASLIIPLVLVVGYSFFDYTYKIFEKSFRAVNKTKTKFILAYVFAGIISFSFLLGLNYFNYSTFSNNEIIVYGFTALSVIGLLIYTQLFSKGNKSQ